MEVGGGGGGVRRSGARGRASVGGRSGAAGARREARATGVASSVPRDSRRHVATARTLSLRASRWWPVVREIQWLSMARRARLESGSSRGGVAGNDGRCSGFITRANGAPYASGGCPAIVAVAGDARARAGDGARVETRGGSSDVRAREGLEALRRRDACARPRVGPTSARPPWSPSLDTRFRSGENARPARAATNGHLYLPVREMPARLESGRFRRSIRGLRFSTNHVSKRI